MSVGRLLTFLALNPDFDPTKLGEVYKPAIPALALVEGIGFKIQGHLPLPIEFKANQDYRRHCFSHK